MIIKLVLFCVWIGFSILEGLRDGNFYHANLTSINSVKHNLHWIFVCTRTIVFGLIGWICLEHFSIFSSIIFIVSLALIFSFVHNGIYYVTRNRLNKNMYPKGFLANSNSSTAKIELNSITRTVMAVIGLIGVVISFLI